MKLILNFAICAALLAPAIAHSSTLTEHYAIGAQDEVEHGGGCRKSSPAGQCCHAGSKPLHCHW